MWPTSAFHVLSVMLDKKMGTDHWHAFSSLLNLLYKFKAKSHPGTAGKDRIGLQSCTSNKGSLAEAKRCLQANQNCTNVNWMWKQSLVLSSEVSTATKNHTQSFYMKQACKVMHTNPIKLQSQKLEKNTLSYKGYKGVLAYSPRIWLIGC
eukprot:445506-Pelagomonas_calceolata.AAC.2